MLNTTDPLDVADELIIMLARVIVIGIAAVYYDELTGLVILLVMALLMLRTSRSAEDDGGQENQLVRTNRPGNAQIRDIESHEAEVA